MGMIVRDDIRDRLVAHRGDHELCPENSMPAFERAVSAGARWLECDVQFTGDLTPVILHDAHLLRLCGVDKSIDQYRAETISGLRVYEPERLGKQFMDTPVPRLDQLLSWLKEQIGVRLFLEIKPGILHSRRSEEIAGVLTPLLDPDRTGIILISSSATILRTLSEQLPSYPLGWVLKTGSPAPEAELKYIFVKEEGLKLAREYHQHGMQVAVYAIDKPDRFHRCLDMGADLIETNCFSRLSSKLMDLS